MRIVLFQGYSGSGKTVTIEVLTKALTKSGWRVGTIKHIHEKKFTIDRSGKDTWRHAKAGALQVIAVAPKEISIVRRRDTSTMTIDEILDHFEEEEFDYILVEGLHRQFSGRRGVSRVICARNAREATELLGESHEGMAFITGRVADGLPENAKGLRTLGGVRVLRMPGDVGIAKGLIAGNRRRKRGVESSTTDRLSCRRELRL